MNKQECKERGCELGCMCQPNPVNMATIDRLESHPREIKLAAFCPNSNHEWILNFIRSEISLAESALLQEVLDGLPKEVDEKDMAISNNLKLLRGGFNQSLAEVRSLITSLLAQRK